MLYIAKQGESLEMICFKHYKTLNKEILSPFLMANHKLLNKKSLEAGDLVELPSLKVKSIKREVKNLWD